MQPLVANQYGENCRLLPISQYEMLWWFPLQVIIITKPENQF